VKFSLKILVQKLAKEKLGKSYLFSVYLSKKKNKKKNIMVSILHIYLSLLYGHINVFLLYPWMVYVSVCVWSAFAVAVVTTSLCCGDWDTLYKTATRKLSFLYLFCLLFAVQLDRIPLSSWEEEECLKWCVPRAHGHTHL